MRGAELPSTLLQFSSLAKISKVSSMSASNALSVSDVSWGEGNVSQWGLAVLQCILVAV